MTKRESMQFDVVIVGAGPAGLAAACRLGELAAAAGLEPGIAVLEKGREVGAHLISGALLDTRALDELAPDWCDAGAPAGVPVRDDQLYWMSGERRAIRVPRMLVPAVLHNTGCRIASLGELCIWLAARAEQLGCDVLPGFAASELLLDENGRIAGVVTGDSGVGRDGQRKASYQPGYELRARYVIFAEGSHGHLGRELERRFALRASTDPQHYALGMKEVWEVAPDASALGDVLHTAGWPLTTGAQGGGFLYRIGTNRLCAGFVVGLNYRNPWLSPYEEFQRWKSHPLIRPLLENGRRIAYGARTITRGGLNSLPGLVVPGGLLVGCDAGFLDGARLKGCHTAIKSGMLAAETVFEALARGDSGQETLSAYTQRLRESWLSDDLHRARNFVPGLTRFGSLAGGMLAFVEHNLMRGRVPWTLRDRVPDHETLVPADRAPAPAYAPPDGVVSFDRLSSVYLSGTSHEEDQPVHLKLRDAAVPLGNNLPRYAEPAQRYCPAAVYEITGRPDNPSFVINAGNCLHCKACEIKDPAGNIVWTPPQGGDGPGYVSM
jgi:electron-transferring-flavoprotein dehydrogenase